ncbi:TPA: helix-turn-helix transcriptional regulator [Salmonella enterica]|uniref:Helix-turn-helix transcriptional regulator n=1 Tax=Salmonella enterica TaxID=28901 RepID=A0A756LGQ4_SALER|nr:helix-turn-helix transcriptional regulator [Salmonella enterica]
MNFHEKIKLVRVAEGLSQRQFCQIIDLPLSTLRKYEINSSIPSIQNLMKITKNPRFKKYALWLTTDETAPEVGQIAPSLSPDGCENSEADQVSTETTQKSPR